MVLGERIKLFQTERGWSQSELAEQLSFHLTYVNRLETRTQAPSLEFIVKAARTFGVSIDQLLADQAEGLQEVRFEDKELTERLRLLESLDEREREAVLTVIDSMLTKHRIRSLLNPEQAPAGR